MGYTEADRLVAAAQRERQQNGPRSASQTLLKAATMKNAGSKSGKKPTLPAGAMNSQKPPSTNQKSTTRSMSPQGSPTSQKLPDLTPIPAKPTPDWRFPGISLEKQREMEARGLKILQDAAKQSEHSCKGPCNCTNKPIDPAKGFSNMPDLGSLYHIGGPEFSKMKHAQDYEGLSQALQRIMQNPKFIKGVQDQVNGTGPKTAKAQQMSALEWQEILGMNQYLNGGKKTHSKTPPTKTNRNRNVQDPSRGQLVQPAKTKAKNQQGSGPQGAPQRGVLGALFANNVPIGGGLQQGKGPTPQAQGQGQRRK